MEEEPIESIRETSRNLLLLNRRKHRDEVTDVRRSMTTLRLCSDTVTYIAKKLKTKSAVTASELHTLKNALVDDAVNVEAVLQTQGALRGLVREISGNDVNKQCAALACCCNLALGEPKACVIVSKAAGPYLIPLLDNMSAELAVTSAWTLGNLAGSGKAACELLTAQGALASLIEQLLINNEETREAMLYALVHFAHQLRDDLKPEHLHKILQILPSLRMVESLQLFFILSCHENFTNHFVEQESSVNHFALKALRYLNLIMLRSHDTHNLVMLFRFAANLNEQDVFRLFLDFFINHNKVEVLQKLLATESVNESVFWFLGNAYKFHSTHKLFEILLK